MDAQLLAMSMADTLPTSVEGAASELTRTGILGAVLVLVGAYAFWATKELLNSNKLRVEDQQKVTGVLLDFSNSMKGVLGELKTAIDSLTKESTEERRTLAELKDQAKDVERSLETQAKSIENAQRTIEKLTQGK